MPIKPPTDGNHVVKDGEWVASIAIRYGYAKWDEDVWQHGHNSALREKRKDPHVLAPRDILYVPPFDPKYESGATEQRHTFELQVPSEVFRLRLLDPDGEPLKNQQYTLEMRCMPGGGTFTQKNQKTNGEGVLEEEIPSTAYHGILNLPDVPQKIQLQLGFLYPMDLNDRPTLIKGAQQRLNWTGFDAGVVDGLDGPHTQGAVRAFQQFCKDYKDKGDDRIIDSGPVDGIIGPKTSAALVTYYGA